jgi:hypothetical protein
MATTKGRPRTVFPPFSTTRRRERRRRKRRKSEGSRGKEESRV